MTENLTEAAILTVVGVLVVFVALIALMVTIVLLSRFASGKAAEARVVAPSIVEEAVQGVEEKQPGPDNETVAAIAVSLARAMTDTAARQTKREMGWTAQPATASPWARAGREELMRSRRKVGHRWGRPSR